MPLINTKMDTNQSIKVLERRNSILAASINAQQLEVESNNMSISKLKDTLDTQLKSLTSEQLREFPEVVAIQDQVTALTTTVTNKDQEISTLTTTKTELEKNNGILSTGIEDKIEEILVLQDKVDEKDQALSQAAETIETLTKENTELKKAPVEEKPPVEEVPPTEEPITP